MGDRFRKDIYPGMLMGAQAQGIAGSENIFVFHFIFTCYMELAVRITGCMERKAPASENEE